VEKRAKYSFPFKGNGKCALSKTVKSRFSMGKEGIIVSLSAKYGYFSEKQSSLFITAKRAAIFGDPSNYPKS
jgi:hypothetical protein